MYRYTRAVLAVLCVAAAGFAIYLLTYADRGPTSEDFRVYGAFLTRLAADRGLRPNLIALGRTSLEMTDPQYETWIPAELRQSKRHLPAEFVRFCGTLCACDFVRKNLAVWRLNPSTRSDSGVSIANASEFTQMPPKKRVLAVTRVGFNLWRNRAVLMYSFDCNDYSPNPPVLCNQIGAAYLQKRNGNWNVDNYSGFTF